jgi:hypothetical protein
MRFAQALVAEALSHGMKLIARRLQLMRWTGLDGRLLVGGRDLFSHGNAINFYLA